MRLDNFAVFDIIAYIKRQQDNERVKMNTLVVKDEIAIDTLMGETESIIAETENVYDFLTGDEIDTKVLDSLDFDDIRSSAEELQSLVVDFADEFNFQYAKDLQDEIENESINLYQNVKYILSAIEDEYSFLMSDDVAKSFGYIRASVNTIRSIVEKL